MRQPDYHYLYHRSMTHLLLLCTALLIVGSAVLFYYGFLDGKVFNPVIEFQSDVSSLKTEKEEYHIGEMVRAHLDFCKIRNISASIQWTLVDDFLITFDADERGVPPGCHTTIFEIKKVPDIAHSGTYRFEGLLSYKLNGWNTVTYSLKTQEFRVVK